ncbi:MAG: radical SAM protein [Candidatus Aminicenantes bacterium]|nr:radical SAM protein [Candidatus Aminicenantes bacterium]
MTTDFNTLLIYLPAADFTQPYPAIPYLAGYLRRQGEKVTIKDLNIDAHEYILSQDFLEKCRQKVDQRFAFLEKRNSLNFIEQKEYLKCLEASGIDPNTLKPGNYLSGFRDKERFFNFKEYRKNSGFLGQALTLISGAYFPTQIDAAGYTTPFFLSSRADIIAQTGKDSNPFIEYYEQKLIPLVAAEKPGLIGMSVTYPSQILQMFAVADLIKKNFPGIHICAGGAFLCRLVLNMPRKKMKTLFDYLDSIIIYEGETALYNLILYLKTFQSAMAKPAAGPGQPSSLQNVIYYDRANYEIIFPPKDAFVENLDELPPPDFHGFPLDKYLSPQVVLPYAPTRGCYWNKCAFCHYGATKEGTARYRERSSEKIIADMEFLAAQYKVNHFAFAIDVMSPVMALNIAAELIKRKLSYRWNTEIKIEKIFTRENCLKLKRGGCLSVAVGLESGNLRILELIEKGFTPQTAGEVIKNFSDAGICVQVMAFLDFPTETSGEAMETIEFISGNKEHISLFTLGNFELLPGSRVFKNPRAYGISNVGYADGDEFRVLCLYKEKNESKLETDAYVIDSAYLKTAGEYAGLEFPFVGAVSTNHTFLYFEHFGKDIFKNPDMQGDTGKEEPGKALDGLSKPKLKPGIKIIEGNFSLREINESLERNTNIIKDCIKKREQSYRQALYKILNKDRVFAANSFYILLEDMEWSELPGQVKEILDLCNGENLFKDIIESKGASNKGFIENVLNRLFSLDILYPCGNGV